MLQKDWTREWKRPRVHTLPPSAGDGVKEGMRPSLSARTRNALLVCFIAS